MAFQLQRSPVRFRVVEDQPPAPTQGRGGFLSSLISEGGAVTGAGIGSFLGPLGTVAGAGLGALIGRLTENKVRDDEFRVGSAFGEAGLSAALGGLGPAFKAIKGGKSAVQGAGRLTQLGQSIDKSASGLAVGTSVRGGGKLTPDLADELYKFGREGSKRYIKGGVKSGAPLNQAYSSQNVLKSVTKALDDEVGKINRAIKPAEMDRIILTAGQKIAESGAITGKTTTLDKLIKIARGKKDIRGLEELRRHADDIAFTNTGAGKTSAAAQAHAFRDAIDEFVTPLSKSYKAVKGDYTTARALRDATTTGSKSAKGLKPFGLPVVPPQVAEGFRSKLGSTLASQPVAAAGRGAGLAFPQLAGRTPGLLGSGQSLGEASTNQPMNPSINNMTNAVTTPDLYQSEGQSSSGGLGFGQESQSQYSLASALADIQRDPQNADFYMQLFEFVSQSQQGQEQKPLSATQQKDANTALSALSDLDILEAELGRDSGVAAKAALPFNSLSNRLTGAGGFEAAQKNIIDALSRLRSGAALTEFETQNFGQLTPNAFDSPELIQQKIQRLREIFLRTANQEPASLELSDALVGASYAS